MTRACKSCRWWLRDEYEVTGHNVGFAPCALTEVRGYYEPVHEKSKAVSQDGCLITAPDFGCVQWEGEEGE